MLRDQPHPVTPCRRVGVTLSALFPTSSRLHPRLPSGRVFSALVRQQAFPPLILIFHQTEKTPRTSLFSGKLDEVFSGFLTIFVRSSENSGSLQQAVQLREISQITGRHSRRDTLRLGSAGLLGLSLPQLLQAEQSAAVKTIAPKADACIVIFLNGGPSHLDMWDMKPDAPAETRGEFNPIATSLPGVQFSDQLPKLAKHMHRSTLIRSMHHSVNNSHAAAVYVALTGHDRGEQGGGFKPTDNPPPKQLPANRQPPSDLQPSTTHRQPSTTNRQPPDWETTYVPTYLPAYRATNLPPLGRA